MDDEEVMLVDDEEEVMLVEVVLDSDVLTSDGEAGEQFHGQRLARAGRILGTAVQILARGPTEATA